MNVPIELVIIGQQQVELVQLKMELEAAKAKIESLTPKPDRVEAPDGAA